MQWVKPGGRIGIVLPNGILSNPGPADEGIRGWILRNCWVLASVELPVETFIHKAGVNILTSLLFLKKKTDKEIAAEVISASSLIIRCSWRSPRRWASTAAATLSISAARTVRSFSRRSTRTQRISVHGVEQEIRVPRKVRAIDDDLPVIAKAYEAFREEYPEPGLRR